MINNGIPQAGRTPFTDEEYRQAEDWKNSALALGEKYRDDLAEAGDDAEKKKAVIKLIYDEVGPVPAPLKLTMVMAIPIVIEINKYQQELEAAEINSAAPWTCPCCNSTNTGKFCMECGSMKPE